MPHKRNDDLNEEPNPYASPTAIDRDDAPASTGDAVRLRGGLLFRRVWLPPPVSAVLEYKASNLGYATVTVAGREVARRWSWLWFVPRFDFTILSERGSLPAVLMVEIDLLLRIRRLAIEVDDELVYEEHRRA